MPLVEALGNRRAIEEGEGMTPVSFFRIHTDELAYNTQRPRGLFTAVGKLVDAHTLSPDEVAEYWRQRTWFEAHLPVPPFYATGNPDKAITWFKNNTLGREMSAQLSFYLSMARKYGVQLWETTTAVRPGKVVYEDEYQIAVVESRHEGPSFETRPLT